MKVQFVRSKKVMIQTKASGVNRRLLFHFALGCAGSIDPLTGMVVNLVNVDRRLEQIQKEFLTIKFESWNEFLQMLLSESFVENHFNQLNVLTLQLVEARNWGMQKEHNQAFFWQNQLFEESDGLYEVTSYFSGLPTENELQELLLQKKISRVPYQKKKLNLLNHMATIEAETLK